VASLDKNSGVVQVGVDYQSPTTLLSLSGVMAHLPLVFLSITPTVIKLNYDVKVTATYSDGTADMVTIIVYLLLHFSSFYLIKILHYPQNFRITMPNANFNGLAGQPNLIPFKDGDFGTSQRRHSLRNGGVCIDSI
jgi:hypothetical protein